MLRFQTLSNLQSTNQIPALLKTISGYNITPPSTKSMQTITYNIYMHAFKWWLNYQTDGFTQGSGGNCCGNISLV